MGTHPIFESDFDCLTECRQETLKSEKLRQTLTARLWSMANLKMSNSAITRENMLSYFSTPWISLLSARQKSSLSPRPLQPLPRATAKLLLLLPIRCFLISPGLTLTVKWEDLGR